METKKFTYGATTLELPATASVDQVKADLAKYYPEISNAQVVVLGNGDVEFRVMSGSKG